MSGRENLMTGGILSGLTRQQVRSREDEIIAFSELEEFIDQPARTYSSGMYLRLAFAAAVHFDPDFLIVDEVLAVGDSRFQQKCIEKLQSFRHSGKALILVSHDLAQIRSLCDEVLVLEEGAVVTQSGPESAIQCYHDLMRQRTEKRAEQILQGPHINKKSDRLGTQEVSIEAVSLCDAKGKVVESIVSGGSLTVFLEYKATASINDMAISLGIYSESDMKYFETLIPSAKELFGPLNDKGTLSCFLPELPLLPARYFIQIGLYPNNCSYVYDYHRQMHVLHIEKKMGIPEYVTGVVSLNPQWSVLEEFKIGKG
jgi:lipopolysaccharide transport system ATP-binding protein